jgi:curved DNA-binding protein CbpA
MKHAPLPDYYELLQVSPRAESETIERVFRHLAKRYHPDAPTGDSERFQQLLEAFRVLSDPAQRASYDVRHDAAQRERWQVLGPDTDVDDADADRRLQAAVLAILLKARRRDPERAGVGVVELERLLDCPEAHMRYHIWYLREHGWITRLENGTLAITVGGADRVLESGSPGAGLHLLRAASAD